jgi:hypothetical protein
MPSKRTIRANSSRRKTIEAVALSAYSPYPSDIFPRVDRLVGEFEKTGLFSVIDEVNYPRPELGLIAQVRQAVWFAKLLAITSAENALINNPRHLSNTKRFFNDLKRIDHLIQRNKNIDHFNGAFFVEYSRTTPLAHGLAYPADATETMKRAMDALRGEIRAYLKAYKLQRAESLRNGDPLSDAFISEVRALVKIVPVSEASSAVRSASCGSVDRPASACERPSRTLSRTHRTVVC